MGTQTNNPASNPENQPQRNRNGGLPGSDMEPTHDPEKFKPEAEKPHDPNATEGGKHV